MFIDKATIKYDNTTEVEAGEDRMVLRQWFEDEDKAQVFVMQPDELREIIELAKLMGWEL